MIFPLGTWPVPHFDKTNRLITKLQKTTGKHDAKARHTPEGIHIAAVEDCEEVESTAVEDRGSAPGGNTYIMWDDDEAMDRKPGRYLDP